jgi:predicted nucleotidyltransferase
VLKLFAWHDRQTNGKDAFDLYRMIFSYADAGNLDWLYNEEIQILEEADHNAEFAGAALLGFDTHQLCSPGAFARVRDILTKPDFADRLAEQVRLSRWPFQPEQLPRILSVLLRFTDPLGGGTLQSADQT